MLLVMVACSSPSDAQSKRISNEEMAALMKKEGVQIVDVRTPQEVSFGIIEGAKTIDFYDPAFESKISALDKTKPIVVYCAVGGRSASAATKLQSLGFKEIYDLKGGFRGWQGAGYPSVKND